MFLDKTRMAEYNELKYFVGWYIESVVLKERLLKIKFHTFDNQTCFNKSKNLNKKNKNIFNRKLSSSVQLIHFQFSIKKKYLKTGI